MSDAARDLTKQIMRYLSDSRPLKAHFVQPDDVGPVESVPGYEDLAAWVNAAARTLTDEERARASRDFSEIPESQAASSVIYDIVRDLEEMIVKALPSIVGELVEIRDNA